MSGLAAHSAPAPVEGTSPFTTPGTRLTWGSGDQWLQALSELEARRHTSKRYRDLSAHLDELARHPDFIHALDAGELTRMQAAVRRYRPPQGYRAGTTWEALINQFDAALVWARRRAAEYDEVEQACRGCMGPCGRCHDRFDENGQGVLFA